MGKAGEFGVCLGDLKKVGCAIVFLKLYFSAYERKKCRCYEKSKRSVHACGQVQRPREMGMCK